MSALSSIVVLHPLLLVAALILPVLWLLLRVTPPRPKTIEFPPLRLLLDLMPAQKTPARSPWWLTALRMLVAGLLILAMAGPVWRPQQSAMPSMQGPLLLMIDDGWTSAKNWEQRQATAQALVELAAEQSRPVALLGFSRPDQGLVLKEAGALLSDLRGLTPAPFTPERAAAVPALRDFLSAQPNVSVVWITDGLQIDERNEGGQAPEPFTALLKPLLKDQPLDVIHPRTAPLALTGRQDREAGLNVSVNRGWGGESAAFSLVARDKKGRVLSQGNGTFEHDDLSQTVTLPLPLELRQEVARLEIEQGRSAGSVWLSDESQHRRRVAIVSETASDASQVLLSPLTYISRALSPFAEVRLSKQAPTEAINSLLNESPSVLVLADIGQLPEGAKQKIADFIDKGGVVVRFSSSGLASTGDDLVPVPLRRGGRSLGGALAWDTPRALHSFEADSPFFGLKVPQDVTVNRQILAEPGPELDRKVWAHLADGTPVVTAQARGQGILVLFHVTADPLWSTLPLSGLFVDMLRRIVNLSGPQNLARLNSTTPQKPTLLAPTRILDGFGQLGTPPVTALPIKPDTTAPEQGMVADHDHPAGLYGSVDAPLAVNVLGPRSLMRPLDLTALPARLVPLEAPVPFDLRPWLIGLAMVLFALDSVAVIVLAGTGWRVWRAKPFLTGLVLTCAVIMMQNPLQADPLSPKDTDSALATRLAYVITGNTGIDETSLAGLIGLTDYIAKHTALEPAPPIGVNPAVDELGVYPLLYWPMSGSQTVPSASALAKIDSFMKNGGTIIFDTRDAGFSSGAVSPETRLLRTILAGMSIPALEPVPSDHVVTRTFYLVDRFPGRFADGKTYIEALVRGETGKSERPSRAGDGVSPIVITSNDLAAAWATGRRGEPLQPINQTMPRQREMALRGGVNLVMYTLTGNYKADQVHVPALLERLGQ